MRHWSSYAKTATGRGLNWERKWNTLSGIAARPNHRRDNGEFLRFRSPNVIGANRFEALELGYQHIVLTAPAQIAGLFTVAHVNRHTVNGFISSPRRWSTENKKQFRRLKKIFRPFFKECDHYDFARFRAGISVELPAAASQAAWLVQGVAWRRQNGSDAHPAARMGVRASTNQADA
jgi:hypothetical protein